MTDSESVSDQIDMPKATFNEVKFVITEKLVSFIQLINQNKECLNSEQLLRFNKAYLPFGHIDSPPLPKSFLIDMISYYNIIKEDERADIKSFGPVHIHNLIKGSKISPLETPKVGYTAAFANYLKDVKAQQIRIEYRSMVGDLPMYKETTTRTFGMAIKGTTKDISIAANVILIMLTGFIVFWYIGSMIFPHNKVNQLAIGIVGIVGALIVETLVLMLTYRKEDLYHDRIAERKLKSLS